MPANTVKVDRSTLFGNPFSIKDYGHDRAVALHRAWIAGAGIDVEAANLAEKRDAVLRTLPSLRGKNLACWCSLPNAGEADNCHAAILMEWQNDERG